MASVASAIKKIVIGIAELLLVLTEFLNNDPKWQLMWLPIKTRQNTVESLLLQKGNLLKQNFP